MLDLKWIPHELVQLLLLVFTVFVYDSENSVPADLRSGEYPGV